MQKVVFSVNCNLFFNFLLCIFALLELIYNTKQIIYEDNYFCKSLNQHTRV